MSEQTHGRVRVERSAKRVRAIHRGVPIFDTVEPRLVWEIPYFPAYYVPRADVRATLTQTDITKHSPSRGDAVYFDVTVGDETVPNAAWSYPEPRIEELRDLIRFEWDAFDEWLEEDEPVYVHPRSPFVRVDILASSRRVQVALDGVQLADSSNPRILFETGLPPRYYLPLADLDMTLLRPSSTTSHCPYKGTASYFDVEVNGVLHKDFVWIYRTTLPESAKIVGLACFYNEKVDITIDGATQDKPRTPFS